MMKRSANSINNIHNVNNPEYNKYKNDASNHSNPFYIKYEFTSSDLMRATIKWWKNPLLWFRRTYIQISAGHVWYYKKGFNCCIYLIKHTSIYEL